MTLRQWWVQTRLAFDEAVNAVGKIARPRRNRSTAEFSQLEERILLSASPAPVVSEVDHELQLAEPTNANKSSNAADGWNDDQINPSQSDNLANPSPTEIVFVDEAAENSQQLIDGLVKNGRDFEVILLERDRDGLSQISEALASRSDLDAVHIVSHGTQRAVKLGNNWISLSNIDAYAGQVSSWADALGERADLLFYGCDLAAGEDGRALLNAFGALCDCDVAASDDDTGLAALGGDWNLEFQIGDIETDIAFGAEVQANWSSLLATVTVDITADEFDGNTSSIANLIATPGGAGISLREAIVAANNTAGADDIHFNIGGGGVQTLTLGSALFPVSDLVNIDATTQGGFSGAPIIEIDATGVQSGISFGGGADGSTLRGFVINRANSYGISISGGGSYNIVGNYIGTNVAGTADLGNGFYGINVVTSTGSNVIGGATAADRNVISGNDTAGIFLISGDNNTVTGNYIGVGANGTTAIGNGSGVRIATSNNTIGGTAVGESNIIAHNTMDGVYVQSGNGNKISGNSIHSNAELGIDLGSNGVTANDALDADSGANDLQNFPVLDSVATGGTETEFRGAFSGAASSSFTIEFYSSPTADPSGNGEGEVYLGSTAVVTDGSGNATINVKLTVGVTPGHFVSATATDSANNTSEFSANVVAIQGVVVDTTSDVSDGTVTSIDALLNNRGADGFISLREAIEATNNTTNVGGNADEIHFNIAGAGPHQITPSGILPNIVDAVIIDGTTEPDYVAPVIQLNGVSAGAGVDGLAITTGAGSTIRGLSIINYGDAGIQVDADNNTIVGNYLGLDTTGAAAANVTGIEITGDSNTVGGSTAADRNIISGNSQDGVYLNVNPTGNVIIGNYIGTNVAGDADLGNSLNGIFLENGANANTIGGDTPAERNIISGNDEYGVEFQDTNTSNNVLIGNYIGLNAAGTAALANSLAGVRADLNADGNFIGRLNPGEGNVISGNATGILIESGSDNTAISGNLIGLNPAGSAAIANTAGGIIVNASTGTTIGSGVAGEGNTISGNTGEGILLTGAATTDTRVQGNYIGTNVAGTAAIANSGSGIRLQSGANANFIGTDLDSTNDATEGNLVSGNGANGIQLWGNAVNGNLVAGNLVGVNAAATAPIGNGTQGIQLGSGADNNTIGGVVADAANIVGGSTFAGIELRDAGTDNNLVQGNYVGTNSGGSVNLANGGGGITIGLSASSNAIGGAAAGAGNTVAFNSSAGVIIAGGGVDNAILGNDIYTNSALGIDLHTLGVDFNDADDADSGSNDLLNYPVLTDVFQNGANLDIDFDIDLLAGNYRIEFFDNATATESSGFGEGETFIGFAHITATGAAGYESFSTTLNSVTASDVRNITTTATEANGGFTAFNSSSEFGPRFQGAGVVTVTTNNDTTDGDTTSIASLLGNAGADGLISLREAITAANNTSNLGGNPDEIHFDISGAGPHAIALTTGLPTITDSVILDGWTEPDYGSAPVIVLDGGSAGSGADGFRITAGNSTVRGFVFSDFDGDGVEISSGNGNTIEGNYFGLDATGTVVHALGESGIHVQSANNTIGGTTTAARNIISGADEEGVTIAGSSATGNVVLGNYIGTDVSGTLDRGNTDQGVRIMTGANGNTIGGSTASARNIISGNDADGIQIDGVGTDGNIVRGNYIGTTVNGLVALANTDDGIELSDDAANTIIGGTNAGDRNVISANDDDGVQLNDTGTDGNIIQGNYIGVGADGVTVLGNDSDGFEIYGGAADNLIGGIAAGAGNVIANQGSRGIRVTDSSTTGNAFLGNLIYSNSNIGIDLDNDGVTTNDLGDGDTGANNLQNFAVLDAAVTNGVNRTEIAGTLNSAASTDFRVEFFSSATADGSGHGEAETFLGAASVTTDGGGNASFAASFTLGIAFGDFVTATATEDLGGGNYGDTSEFGLNVQATPALVVDTTSDVSDGVTTSIAALLASPGADGFISLREAIIATNNTTNGATPDEIHFDIPGAGPHSITVGSGGLPNLTDAVVIDGTTEPDFVGAPIIELNGTSAGAADGLVIDAANTTIKGLVINRFSQDGIVVNANGAVIQGNYIGTSTAGNSVLANLDDGIDINASSTHQIGGTGAGEANIIAGNSAQGINIGGASSAVAIVGNFIGTDFGGTIDLGNGAQGIYVNSSSGNHTIGGTSAGSGNTIAFNTGRGVRISTSNNNAILGNLIYANTDIGIDIDSSGVSSNDLGDGDTGANNLQNFPVLSTAVTDEATSVDITGTLNSTASTLFRVEFFASTTADGSGFGEGERFLGFANVTTDGGGNAAINESLSGVVNAGEFITATATDPANNTSEFSATVAAVGGVIVVDTTSDVLDGNTTSIANLVATPGADGFISLREAITAANNTTNGGSPDQIRFNIGPADARHFYYQDDSVAGQVTLGNIAATTASSDASILDIDPDYAYSWWSIQPSAILPDITDAVVFDGYTQTGAAANTVASPGASDAVLRIEIDGSAHGGNNLNFLDASDGSTVRGLVINQSSANGIHFSTNSDSHAITGNYVGTDVSGTLDLGNINGITANANTDNSTIGGASPSERNLISGNNVGVNFVTNTALGHVVKGNYIGVDVTGAAALGNAFGIQIAGGNITVGGPAAGEANVISANTSSAIIITNPTTGNVVQGNLIGTAANGTSALGNRWGFTITGATTGNLIGGVGAGEGNTIAYSTSEAIRDSSTGNNSYLGNRIYGSGLGIDLNSDGVTYNDADDADSGPNDLLNFPVLTNVVQNGPNLDVDFDVDLPAGNYRLEFFDNASGLHASGFGEGESIVGVATITVTGAAGYESFSRTLLAATPSATANVTVNATEDLGGGNYGATSEYGPQFLGAGVLVVDTVSDVADGDTSSISALLGNRGADGFISLREAITAANSTTNIGGNPDEIHFDIAGAGVHTIVVSSILPDITDAVVIDGATEPDFVSTPVIELNGSATGAGDDGLELNIGSNGSTIRGLAINRFGGDGIVVRSDSNLIVGNFLGVNPSGTVDLGNANSGVFVTGANNTIGGASAADRNLISGNAQRGVYLSGAGATGNSVIGNYIGTDITGALDLGNSQQGVRITASAFGNQIGGVAAGETNVIAFNTEGVALSSSAGNGNSILGNSVHANTSLGIDLGEDGVTLNDVGDGDTGANNLQNSPWLETASSTGGNTTISGRLRSAASTSYRIEFYASSSSDASGFGEGQTFVGAATVTTDASGEATFGSTFAVSVSNGDAVSAIATVDLGGGNYGDSSEFARNVLANSTAALIAAKDTYLDDDNQTLNYGASPDLIVDKSGGGIGDKRAAIEFDLSNIPVGATILSADLLLEATVNTDAFDVNVYEFLEAWVEGNGNGAPGAANWNERQSGTNWTTAGGEFDGAILATVNTAAIGQHSWSITTLVRDWFTGAKVNNGIILGSPETGTESVTYSSSEGAIAPVLAINYSVPTNTLIVDTTSDVSDGNTSSIAALLGDKGGDGFISLREAIIATNNTANAGSPDVIHFDIAGAGPHSITVGAAGLPSITEAVIIDGSSEPDFAGAPIVELNGAATSGGVDGLYFDSGSGGSTVRGLVINRFADTGVFVWVSSANNAFYGNYIGTDVTGAVDLGNVGAGFNVSSDGQIIGSAALADRNVIAGNAGNGIQFANGSSNNVVQGNLIGSGVGGQSLGNNNGLVFGNGGSSGTLVGGAGAGEGNTIANNTAIGIRTSSTSGSNNAFIGNAIFANGGIGIDHNIDGATYNDPEDADLGPNGLLNFPVLTNVFQNGGNLDIDYEVDLPAGNYRVEFFDNSSGLDGGGFGEGQTLVGFDHITATGSAGYESFSTTLTSVTASDVLNISTIATEANGAFTGFSSSSEFGPQFHGAGVLVVDTNSDISDGDTSSIAALLGNRGADGFISLREAITATNNTANISGGPDEIQFDIAGAGVHTIAPTTALPTIIDAVTIDGLTQTGAAAGVLNTGTQHTLLIELDGSSAGGAVGAGLDVQADDTTIRGLIINNWATNGATDAIQVVGADDVTIEANYLGVNAAGTAAAGNQQSGLILDGAATATIQNNLISGNLGPGIIIQQVASTANLIRGNLIGTAADGATAVANADDGIRILLGAATNTIGGVAVGDRNVISGNTGDGVEANGSGVDGNTVLGNYVGLTRDGSAALANGVSGIRIANGAQSNTIGGTAGGSSNYIAGNDSHGIHIEGSMTDSNLVQFNYIGFDGAATARIANASNAVLIDGGAQANVIGGASAGNFIVGTGTLIQVSADNNFVQGNFIGTNTAGTASIGNANYGVSIFAGTGNVIGTNGDGATDLAERNVIAVDSGAGQIIVSGGGGGNVIAGNYLGVNAAGTAGIVTNANSAVYITGSPNNRVGTNADGTSDAAERNVIGDHFRGVVLEAAGTTGTVVAGNYIGTDAAGSGAIANTQYGVWVRTGASSNIIGGTAAAAGNLIANSGNEGVQISEASDNNAILGNSIRSSGAAGIDLNLDGVTYNDADDADSGANELLNFPVLTNVFQNGANLDIDFEIDLPAGNYRIEFFDNAGGLNASGFGEGQTFVGSASISAAGAGGYESFSTTLSSVTASDVGNITVTVTEDLGGGNFGSTSEFGPQFLGAGVLVVDTTAETNDGDTSSIASLLGNRGVDGFISLREAILAANNTANIGGNPDEIHFNIAGAGPHSIAVGAGGLPDIDDAVIIDGATEPDFSGAPILELDGTSAGSNQGLVLDSGSDGSTIRSLVINRFGSDGILIRSSGNRIEGNWIGLDTTGAVSLGNDPSQDGIDIEGDNNTIGGSVASARNVIVGSGDGITIDSSDNNVIRGNYIGTNAAGTVVLGNAEDGIDVDGDNNIIGGANAGDGNLIAGSAASGVLVTGNGSDDNQILGNSIYSNSGLGIDLDDDGATFNDGEDSDSGPNALLNFPVLINVFQNGPNLDIDFDIDLAPGDYRVEFFDNAIGLDPGEFGEGQTFIGFANITATGAAGYESFSATLNSVTASDVENITVTSTEDLGVGNFGATSEFGPQFHGAGVLQVDTISDTNDGDTSSITTLLGDRGADGFISLREAIIATNNTANIGGNPDEIHFDIAGAGPHTIAVGSQLPTITDAVLIDGASEPDFSGSPIVELNGASAGGGSVGLQLDAGGSTIRGLVINRFGGDGINIAGNASNTIVGNFIGTDVTGALDRGNGGDGIEISTSTNMIGGATAADRNVIAGNGQDGIRIVGAVTGNVIRNNFVGVNATGTAAIGNAGDGILVDGAVATVIGSGGAGNVISGNEDGIQIQGASANNTVIQGNVIGKGAGGAGSIANTANGVFILNGASASFIGGTGASEGNTIEDNLQSGIALDNSAGGGHLIRGNAIYGNSGLGIDLNNDGVTVNDVGDIDAGANSLQNFPDLTASVTSGSDTVITGSLNSVASTTFAVHFYSSPTADGSGFGEGGVYLGTDNVTTDGSGNAVINSTLTGVALTSGHAVSATATDPSNNTSEFGAVVTAVINTLVVDTTSDIADGNTSTIAALVANKGADGFISLREAIIATNNTANVGSPDEIRFDIPLSDPGLVDPDGIPSNGDEYWSIQLTSSLPTIDEALLVDATSQPVFSTTPIIELNGTSAGASNGLTLGAGSDGSTIRGLVINRFGLSGIRVESSDNHLIAGNYLGVDAAGAASLANADHGVRFEMSDGSTVGGVVALDRNIISGNADVGLQFSSGSSNHVVIGNFIGVAADGTSALSNAGAGIRIGAASTGIRIGGVAAGEGNTIANNVDQGVRLDAGGGAGHALLGNSIYGNGNLGFDIAGDGVTFNDTADADSGANDLLNFPVLTSVAQSGGDLDIDFDVDLPAGNYRVEFFDNASGLDSSGFGQGQAFVGAASITSAGSGAYESFSTSLIGVTASNVNNITVAATLDLGGGNFGSSSEFGPQYIGAGILVVDTTSDVVDGDTSSISSLLGNRGLDGLISLREAISSANNSANIGGNPDVIRFDIAGAGPHSIQPLSALPDINDSVRIDGASEPDFAGTPIVELNGSSAGGGVDGLRLIAGSDGSTIRGLVINRFGGDGIEIVASSGGNISGNYIGVDVAGASAAGNTEAGVRLSGGTDNFTIGGTAAADRNVISGNGGSGVHLQDLGTDSNRLEGNYLGLAADGASVLGNGLHGVLIELAASGNVIGGGTAGHRNIISGNVENGVTISGAGADNNVLMGNYLGTNAAGTQARANSIDGVSIRAGASGNTIGGLSAGQANLISGNAISGVTLFGAGTQNNLVLGNLIGVDAAGTGDLGNGGVGVDVFSGAQNNRIGGSALGAGNVIAFNSRAIYVQNASVNNAILANAIHSNDNFGIDLGADGVTLNDAEDADAGPNDLLNFPVLTNVFQNGANLDIDYEVDLPAGNFRIEFFDNPSGLDSSGFGQGETFIGSHNITSAGAVGYESFTTTLTTVTASNVLNITIAAIEDLGGGNYGASSEFGPQYFGAGVLVVDTISDINDGNTTSIASLLGDRGADGFISLREAILAANNTTNIGGSPDQISFDIAGGGPHTIQPTSSLPDLTDAVFIDGWSEPDFVSAPVVELDGGLAGLNGDGLRIATAGGGSTIRGLAINNFLRYGIELDTSDANQLVGNFLGVDTDGLTAAGNFHGVFVNGGDNNTIGGTTAAERNVISANFADGVLASFGSDNNVIQGNFIGLGADGNTALANQSAGVSLAGATNTAIGGLVAGAGNVISANASNGIQLNSSDNNSIQGNIIGADAAGVVDRGNIGNGILLQNGSSANTIGGALAAASNVVSGNDDAGIRLQDAGTTNNIVQGNFIGTQAGGVGALGNVSQGIGLRAGAANNLIGGANPGEGNVIANNGGDGIAASATAGVGNAILSNSSFNNTGLAIDLDANGVTVNDAFDADNGSNDLLNFPMIDRVLFSGGTANVEYALDVPAGNYRVEFFTNTAIDASDFGEGETFAAFQSISHLGVGVQVFSTTFAATAGSAITATATENLGGGNYGSTSEFSRANLNPVVDLDADDSSGQTLSEFSTVFTEDGGPINVADSDASITDIDSLNLVSLTVNITNLLDVGEEFLAANTSGTSISAGYAGGVLTLSGADTLARYRQVLRTLTYENTSQNPDGATRVLTFVASDGLNTSAVASAYVVMAPINDAPVAAPEQVVIQQLQTLSVAAPGVLANDTDVDTASITATLVTDVSNGVLNLAADGSYTYTPNGAFSGIDSFTYVANDGSLDSNPVTVTITVEVTVPFNPTPTPTPIPPPGDPPEDLDPEVEPPSDPDEAPEELPEAAPPALAPVVGAIPVLGESPQVEDGQRILAAVSQREFAGLNLRSSQSNRPAQTTKPAPRAPATLDIPADSHLVSSQPLTADFGTSNAKDSSQDLLLSDDFAVSAVTVVATSLSVGYVIWLIRGGSLFFSLVVSMPAWVSFDPLPILDKFEDASPKEPEEEEESLQSMVQ